MIPPAVRRMCGVLKLRVLGCRSTFVTFLCPWCGRLREVTSGCLLRWEKAGAVGRCGPSCGRSRAA